MPGVQLYQGGRLKYTVKVLPKQPSLSQNNGLKQKQIEARIKKAAKLYESIKRSQLKYGDIQLSFSQDVNYFLTLIVHVFPVFL